MNNKYVLLVQLDTHSVLHIKSVFQHNFALINYALIVRQVIILLKIFVLFKIVYN